MSLHVRGTQAALAYHEPSIVAILSQSSFLLVSNTLDYIVNSLLNCGLIGQILVGVAWGTPGGQILSRGVEDTMVQLGYVGLILIVFEGESCPQHHRPAMLTEVFPGGLSTDFRSLKANAVFSVAVAATGIAAPIGLSFVLGTMVGASKLQSFAAGAALCSTSLGTTFTVLRSCGLSDCRLGVVLASAAMLDDVAGLVMVQVVSNLGTSAASVPAVSVLRPVLVSLAFAGLTPAVCLFVIKPATLALNASRQRHGDRVLDMVLRKRQTAFIVQTLFLVGMVVTSSYAGTSNLFAAYVAGCVISWWDHEVPHVDMQVEASRGDVLTLYSSPSRSSDGDTVEATSGLDIYKRYYEGIVRKILQPFFFGSIGFSIPISSMFSGPIVWKGIVYAILMFIGKLFCGVWLIRFGGIVPWIKSCIKIAKLEGGPPAIPMSMELPDQMTDDPKNEAESTVGPGEGKQTKTNQDSILLGGDKTSQRAGDVTSRPETPRPDAVQEPELQMAGDVSSRRETPQPDAAREPEPQIVPNPTKPLSLYPAAILGFAMVARGEIGFLISSVAQSSIFPGDDDSGESEIFLVVTWAIVLCTLVGPFCVGLLVRRVKALEADGSIGTRQKDVLGVWGPLSAATTNATTRHHEGEEPRPPSNV